MLIVGNIAKPDFLVLNHKNTIILAKSSKKDLRKALCTELRRYHFWEVKGNELVLRLKNS
jgi:hypothetical protein